jgi:hypothetical protein
VHTSFRFLNDQNDYRVDERRRVRSSSTGLIARYNWEQSFPRAQANLGLFAVGRSELSRGGINHSSCTIGLSHEKGLPPENRKPFYFQSEFGCGGAIRTEYTIPKHFVPQ